MGLRTRFEPNMMELEYGQLRSRAVLPMGVCQAGMSFWHYQAGRENPIFLKFSFLQFALSDQKLALAKIIGDFGQFQNTQKIMKSQHDFRHWRAERSLPGDVRGPTVCA